MMSCCSGELLAEADPSISSLLQSTNNQDFYLNVLDQAAAGAVFERQFYDLLSKPLRTPEISPARRLQYNTAVSILILTAAFLILRCADALKLKSSVGSTRRFLSGTAEDDALGACASAPQDGEAAKDAEDEATEHNQQVERIPWTEEPGGLQSTGWQRVGHD